MKILENEPMSLHTTFKVGGNAHLFMMPENRDELVAALDTAREKGMKHFILGGGANVLFPDEGYDGIVISTEAMKRIWTGDDGLLHAECGAAVSDAAFFSCREGYSGLHVFYSMPGSVGGAVFMNARCYNVSVSDILRSVVYLSREGEIRTAEKKNEEFGYKISPFQKNGGIILEAVFGLQSVSGEKEREELEKEMNSYKEDRTSKGHFLYPCAGSVFKNNRNFGEPTGKLIDSLNLRGYTVGGAGISEHHANIIVNRGNATASDIKTLVAYVEERVKEALGFTLEREIIYVE